MDQPLMPQNQGASRPRDLHRHRRLLDAMQEAVAIYCGIIRMERMVG